jgi:alginate O-acetyltransferase complex protein AlgI
MTLGDWLRNYLYFPLGGSRKGLLRTCLNLMIVMVIAGIWHGNNWGFLIWGALHGLGLVIHRLTQSGGRGRPQFNALWSTLPGTLLAWGFDPRSGVF